MEINPDFPSCVTLTPVIVQRIPWPPAVVEDIKFACRTRNIGEAAIEVATLDSLYAGYKDARNQLKLFMFSSAVVLELEGTDQLTLIVLLEPFQI